MTPLTTRLWPTVASCHCCGVLVHWCKHATFCAFNNVLYVCAYVCEGEIVLGRKPVCLSHSNTPFILLFPWLPHPLKLPRFNPPSHPPFSCIHSLDKDQASTANLCVCVQRFRVKKAICDMTHSVHFFKY